MAENVFLFIPNIIGKFDAWGKAFPNYFTASNAKFIEYTVKT